MNLVQKLYEKPKLTIFLIEALLLISHTFIPTNFLMLRLVIGVISYFFIPGFLLCGLLGIKRTVGETLGTALLFGLAIQLLVFVLIWSLFISSFNLNLIPFITFMLVNVMLLKHSNEFKLEFQKEHLFSTLFFIMLLAFAVRLYYFFINSSALGIDGGLYCDFAREIAMNGKFSSNIINDGWLDPFYNVKGFMSYPSTVFSIASFFMIGDVSFVSAKITVLFVGLLVVFMIYRIAFELFNEKIAHLAGFISAVLPILAFYSSILHGPEILSGLFALGSISFFVSGLRSNNQLKFIFMSGVFAVLTYGAWGIQAFILLIISLGIVFIIFNAKNRKLCVYCLFLVFIAVYVSRFASIPYAQLVLVTIPVICLFLIFGRYRRQDYLAITFFIVTLVLMLQLFFVHNYLIQNIYVSTSTETLNQNPINVISPFTFTASGNVGIDYFWSGLSRFWYSIIMTLSPLLFGVSIASFFSAIHLKEKFVILIFPVISSVLLIYSLPQYVVWYGDLFPDRFMIVSISFLIILSAVTIDALIGVGKATELLVTLAGKTKKLNVKKLSLFFVSIVLLLSLIPIHDVYLKRFDQGYNDALDWYGLPTVEWIKTYGGENGVFLASEPRRLAWLTDMTFVGMTMDSTNLGVSELNSLIQEFNVSYVIVDTFLMKYVVHSYFFNDLYESPLNIGETFPIVEETHIVQIIDDFEQTKNRAFTQQCYGLKLLFDYSEEDKTTRIYQVVKLDLVMELGFIDASFSNGWVARRGDAKFGNNLATVFATTSQDWAYINLNASTLLIDTNVFPYLAIKVRGNSNFTTNFWTSLVDVNNGWHQIQSDLLATEEFKLYVYDLGAKIEEKIININLGVSGSDWPVVEYDWVAIYRWEIK